jgi:nicotinamidase-related amidase
MSFVGSGRSRHLVCLDLVRPAARAADRPVIEDEARRIHSGRLLIDHARTMGWGVSHVLDHTARTRRLKAIDGLEPLQVEPVFYRTGVSAFSNRMFRQGVQDRPEAELIILALSLSRTCLATALSARDQGVAVTLVEDVMAGSVDTTAGFHAIHTLSRSMAAPFLGIARTSDLIDRRRGLRVVTVEGARVGEREIVSGPAGPLRPTAWSAVDEFVQSTKD